MKTFRQFLNEENFSHFTIVDRNGDVHYTNGAEKFELATILSMYAANCITKLANRYNDNVVGDVMYESTPRGDEYSIRRDADFNLDNAIDQAYSDFNENRKNMKSLVSDEYYDELWSYIVRMETKNTTLRGMYWFYYLAVYWAEIEKLAGVKGPASEINSKHHYIQKYESSKVYIKKLFETIADRASQGNPIHIALDRHKLIKNTKVAIYKVDRAEIESASDVKFKNIQLFVTKRHDLYDAPVWVSIHSTKYDIFGAGGDNPLWAVIFRGNDMGAVESLEIAIPEYRFDDKDIPETLDDASILEDINKAYTYDYNTYKY